MGVLSRGRPLTWSEILPIRSLVKQHALNDLISIIVKHRCRTNDRFLWGDEVEYSLVRFDHQKKRVQLLLKADEILSRLREINDQVPKVVCHAEDCNFVIEGVPSEPYSSDPIDYQIIEKNIRLRRDIVQQLLQKDEYILSIAAFPRLGCLHCTCPSYESDPVKSFEQSICCPDQMKSPNHPRTMFLNRNVIERRRTKVSVNVPIYRDRHTANPFEDDFSNYGMSNWRDLLPSLEKNFIHLDSSSIGWGCSCLQVTFQGASLEESLHLYDQLLPLTPIFLALSTSCPVWRGHLSDIDSRWNVLSETTDDRTAEEVEKKTYPSSRYSSAPCYLGDSSDGHFNDLHLNIDENAYRALIEHGCPVTLSKHFAHLFLRDPLYVTDEQVHSKEDPSSLYAFENHNSMVWNSLRFKPPPSNDEMAMGWRIEFRPMELQITDFENAALAVFLTVLTRSLLTFRVDLRLPISLVHENMQRAQRRNTLLESKFHFPDPISRRTDEHESHSHREMSMDEIINGSEHFLGLKTYVDQYLNTLENIDVQTRQTLNTYIRFISQRAQGQSLTNAMWMRQFVLDHPLYKEDSMVNEEIQYDLLCRIEQKANGEHPIDAVLS